MARVSHQFHGILIPAVLAWLATTAGAALSIDNFTAATNDRFANEGAFLAAADDLSGVGRDASGRWATLIGVNIFLSATHHHPAVNSTVYFFPGNDPAATPVARTVAGGQQLSGTDLWIGHFAAAVPASIAWYPFADVPIETVQDFYDNYANDYAYMTGISPTAAGYGASNLTDMAVGNNRLEGFLWDVTAGSTGDVLALVQNEPGDGVYGYTYETYESFLQSGDSGSPLLLPSAGGLQMAGTAWAISNVEIAEGVLRPISIYTYTGNYATAIDGYRDVYLVPEPSTAGVLLCLQVLALLSRRR